jgi:hypothetical protein
MLASEDLGLQLPKKPAKPIADMQRSRDAFFIGTGMIE